VFCLLKAIEAQSGRPPGELRLLIEGERSTQSRVVRAAAPEPERTRADAVLIADMAYIAPRWPAVYTTLRGLCYAEITVRTAKSDLHWANSAALRPTRTKSSPACSAA